MVFDAILSPAAARLYERLLTGERIKVVDGDEQDPHTEGSPAHELVTNGFAAESDRGEPTLVMTEPGTALVLALKTLVAEIESKHNNLLALIDGFRTLRHDYHSQSGAETEILPDRNEIILLSDRLIQGTRTEAMSFATHHTEEPDKVRVAMPAPSESEAPTVPTRTVYTQTCVDLVEPMIKLSIAAGEEARIVRSLPHKMVIVDHERAMVALSGTGLQVALLTRSRPLIEGLTVWERAIPYNEQDPSHGLTPIERRVLTQLATGSKDEAIAQRLNVTVRTVRRHITSAINKLGAENRFAAGVLAARRGWI